jgi:hypothetical protein
MEARAGAILRVPSNKVGRPERRGTIEEVMRSATGPRFRVRWDDGSRSLYQPHGAYQIESSRNR